MIRLHWEKTLFIHLKNGDLMDDKWYRLHKTWLMPEEEWKTLHAFAKDHVRKMAVQFLDSDDAHDRATGASVCGQENIKDAIPKLRSLLKDEAHSMTFSPPTGWRDFYFVQEAAKNALKALGEKVEDDSAQKPVK